jgi:hypothetical protein
MARQIRMRKALRFPREMGKPREGTAMMSCNMQAYAANPALCCVAEWVQDFESPA